jgi:hypothetical protein
MKYNHRMLSIIHCYTGLLILHILLIYLLKVQQHVITLKENSFIHKKVSRRKKKIKKNSKKRKRHIFYSAWMRRVKLTGRHSTSRMMLP